MRNKIRIGFSVLWTASLFTVYMCIRDYFAGSVWGTFLMSLGLVSLAAAAYILVPRLLSDRRNRGGNLYAGYRRLESSVYTVVSDRALFLHLWFILTVFYVPAYIALFPGTFGYDTPVQIAQYLGETELTSHHPLAHTFLVGFFFSLGDKLFHSYFAGFAIYSALQWLGVTGAVAYSLTACKRHGVPLIWMIVGALWAAVNPYLQVLAFNSTKDILFGVFLLCFCVSVWDFLEFEVTGRGPYVRVAVFGILVCLFRNQGIYILLAMILLCLLFRMGKRGLCLSMAVACLISKGFFMLSAGVLGIPEGDRKEMLCVPMQQAARVCLLYQEGEEGSVTPEEYETVTQVIPQEGIRSYLSDAADNVKIYFRTDVLLTDPGKYMSAYFSLGLKNLHEYLMAWVYLVHYYWDMGSSEYRGLAMAYTFPELNHWGIAKKGYMEKYWARLYGKINAMENPLFQRPDSVNWLLAALSGLAIARRRKGILAAILPLGLYFGTILLGPVALLRYLFPLTLSTPMVFGMLFQRNFPITRLTAYRK